VKSGTQAGSQGEGAVMRTASKPSRQAEKQGQADFLSSRSREGDKQTGTQACMDREADRVQRHTEPWTPRAKGVMNEGAPVGLVRRQVLQRIHDSLHVRPGRRLRKQVRRRQRRQHALGHLDAVPLARRVQGEAGAHLSSMRFSHRRDSSHVRYCPIKWPHAAYQDAPLDHAHSS
jgi:hypothetical protein